MGLTLREKEHWRDRIARRIDHTIEELQASEDPGFFERVRSQAEKQAWTSLGLKKMQDEVAKAREEEKCLDQRIKQLWANMLAVVSGEPADDGRRHYSQPSEISSAVRRRSLFHERELLEQSALGQKILHLQREKEELLDTVWLATSPTQVKQLWSRFAEVLKWEPPELQQQALSIEPMSDES